MEHFAFPCGEKNRLKSIESVIMNDEQSHLMEILVRLYNPFYKPWDRPQGDKLPSSHHLLSDVLC